MADPLRVIHVRQDEMEAIHYVPTALTDDEHRAMDLTAELASLVRQIIGDGPAAVTDWNEAVVPIHALQTLILSQAARRLYPDRYRLLGQRLDG